MNTTSVTHRQVDTQWFAKQLEASGLSQRSLARLMHTDHSTLSRLFHGKQEMRIPEATEIARYLNVPVSEVLKHAGLPVDDGRSVPVIGYLDAEAEAHMGESDRRIDAPMDLPSGASALVWRTSCTPLEMLDGLVLFIGKPGPVTAEHLNRWCVVGMSGGCSMFRYVKRGYRPGRYNLLLTFSVNMEDVALDWAAPAYWLKL